MIAPWLGPAVLWTGIGGALLLIVAGVAVVARAGIRVSDRLARYESLPIFDEVDAVQQKIARVEARLGHVSDLIDRAKRALLALRDSRLQIQVVAESLNFAAQLARAMFLGPEKKSES